MFSSKYSAKRKIVVILLCVLLSDLLIVSSFLRNTVTVPRLQQCSPKYMVPNVGLDVEVIDSLVPSDKVWFPTGIFKKLQQYCYYYYKC